jgi:hypothetical protein
MGDFRAEGYSFARKRKIINRGGEARLEKRAGMDNELDFAGISGRVRSSVDQHSVPVKKAARSAGRRPE